jgi:glyoxylase-like metal-dependent hydrolase (beta-lactamase superfamily II)
MLRRAAVVLLSLAGCAAPPIAVVPEASVARTVRSAREVEVCRLDQERDSRARLMGVSELSFAPWNFVIGSVAVKHPAGLVIVDPAFGESIAADLAGAGPMTMAVMGTAHTKQPLVKVMREAGLDPADVRLALLTHAHWDHTGALGDLPNARVLVNRVELEWTRHFRGMEHGVMTHLLHRARHQLYTFALDGPAIDGFPGSFDVYGDGSIVGVPMPGHTPGSTAWLVRGEGGVTYLFSGDTSWTFRGVELPAHKSVRAFDEDLPALSKSLGRLHAFLAFRPDVVVIPSHDGEALERIPACAP